MLVSSLWTTSPLAACRINSLRMGRMRVARSSTISHWSGRAAESGDPPESRVVAERFRAGFDVCVLWRSSALLWKFSKG